MEDELVNNKLNWKKILRRLSKAWSASDLREFHGNAIESFKKITSRMTTELNDQEVRKASVCVICMSNEASSYIVHGKTAHGGFCPSCAMETMIGNNRACPICRMNIHGIIISTEKGDCKCGKSDCRREIYSTSHQIHNEETRIVEKYECEELDRHQFKQKLCDVF